MSIIHGGQWPGFFHPVAYHSFAFGPSHTDASVDDIMDLELRNMIARLQQANTCSDIGTVVEGKYDVFSISGCYPSLQKFSEKTRDQLVKDMTHFLVVGRNMPVISQFLEGLEACALGRVVLKYPHQFQEVFCKKPQTLTEEMIEQYSQILITLRLVPKQGFRRREPYHTDGKADVTLKELLAFVTGSDQIPYLGFGVDPSIEFLTEGTFPKVNTCAMVLRLPLHTDFNRFKECMEFGKQNSPGFGMA